MAPASADVFRGQDGRVVKASFFCEIAMVTRGFETRLQILSSKKVHIDTTALRFEIGRTDVYDHRTASPSAYETSRLPIGQLLLKPVGTITHVKLRNDIWNAEIRGELTKTVSLKPNQTITIYNRLN